MTTDHDRPPSRRAGEARRTRVANARLAGALLSVASALGCRPGAPPPAHDARAGSAEVRGASDASTEVLTRAEEGGRWGFRDARGAWAIAPTWAWAEPFSEGLAAVEVGARWGYIDRAGRVAIEARYLDAGGFSEGLAAVLDERGWRYVDRAGATRLAGPFERAGAFRCGVARVRLARAFLLGARPHGTYESAESAEDRSARARAAVLAEVAGDAPRAAPDGLDDVALDGVYRDADRLFDFGAHHAWTRAPQRLREPQWEERAWRAIDARGAVVAPSRVPACEGEAPRATAPPPDLATRLDRLDRAFDRTPFFREVNELGAAAVPVLVAALAAPRKVTRLNALEALVRLGPAAEAAVPALTAALDDPSGDVLLFAAWALGRIGAAAAPAIPALLRNDARHAAVIEAAVEAIDPSRPEPAAVRARRRSREPLAEAERRVARGDAAVIPELVAALSTPRRDRAVALLGAAGPLARPAAAAVRAVADAEAPQADGDVDDLDGYTRRCGAWAGAVDALWRITADAPLVLRLAEAQLEPPAPMGLQARCDPWALRVMTSMGAAAAPSGPRLRRYAARLPAAAEAVRVITGRLETP